MKNYENSENPENSKFLEWVKETHKNRIDRGRARHPVMFSVRKYADERIIEIYKRHTGQKNSSISIFNEDDVTPSSVDKYLHKFDGIYKQVLEKLKFYKKEGKTKFKQFHEIYYLPYFQKLDDFYQNSKKWIFFLFGINLGFYLLFHLGRHYTNT